MSKTPFRTPNDPLIVTSGDLIRGEDGTSPADILVRGGEDSTGATSGAPGEFRGGDGVLAGNGGPSIFRGGDALGTGNGATAEFRGGDGEIGGSIEVRGGDGSVTSGGPMLVRAGDGITSGGILSIEGGAAATGTGGALTISAGAGPAGGGSLAIVAGDGSGGGALSLVGGTGVSLGGPVGITGGNDTGTSGDGGDITITGGAVTNAAGLGDGGSIILAVGVNAGLGSPGSLVFDYTTWPATDGAPGQVLSTDGAGALSWITDAAGVTDLQTAYVGGNTILTDGANGDFDVSGTEAVSLDSDVSSNFDVSGSSGGVLTLTLGAANAGAGDGTIVLTGDDVAVTNSVLRGSSITERFQLLGGTQVATVDATGPSVYLKGQDSATRLGAELTVANSTVANGSIIGRGGNGISGSTAGGSADMIGGSGFGAGSGAQASIQAGDGGVTAGDAGFAFVLGGDGGAGGGDGGGVTLTGGAATTTGTGGSITMTAGASPSGTPGTINNNSPLGRDAGGMKFGLISATPSSGTTGPLVYGAGLLAAYSAFAAAPGPIVMTAVWVHPAGPPTPPLTSGAALIIHSVSATGFAIDWTGFATTAGGYEIHWVAYL